MSMNSTLLGALSKRVPDAESRFEKTGMFFEGLQENYGTPPDQITPSTLLDVTIVAVDEGMRTEVLTPLDARGIIAEVREAVAKDLTARKIGEILPDAA